MQLMDTVVILDFGSQYAQLIARRVREHNTYCELFAWNADPGRILALKPKAFILSGGPDSVYSAGAATLPDFVLAAGVPVLGICYGMQLLARTLGGDVQPGQQREYGRAAITAAASTLLERGAQQVWMSHGDQVRVLPPGFVCSASGEGCAFAAMENTAQRIFALQFHPEVEHTPNGAHIIGRFLALAGVSADWLPAAIADGLVAQIRTQVGSQRAIAALSGGVDSAVAVALAQRALGGQLDCFYVDTGLMRANETAEVVAAFKDLGAHFTAVDASTEFLADLQDVSDPEEKRRRIGARFIRVFEREARRVGAGAKFLVQGTIYPDVVESSGSGREQAATIKTHHNVGGLPPDLDFELVEPLRYLFKDEVRKVGTAIGLPDALVWRQPFPGPGLAIRCLGCVTPERLVTLRAADAIMRAELASAQLERAQAAQAFAVLLPVKSVGVMGDSRTHEEVVALRCVTTSDFMTADWTRLPYELLATISSRIVNEVPGINRVVYDITSKPPATIEWE